MNLEHISICIYALCKYIYNFFRIIYLLDQLYVFGFRKRPGGMD